MPALRLAVPVVLLALLAASGARAADFFSAIRDLPLMPGLVERAEAAVVFEHPGGQATTALASGPVAPAAVRKFYRAALPPLGWVPECATPPCPAPDRYRRDGEALELDLAAERDATAVRFLLTRDLSNPQ